jgi:hypothetical protein
VLGSELDCDLSEGIRHCGLPELGWSVGAIECPCVLIIPDRKAIRNRKDRTAPIGTKSSELCREQWLEGAPCPFQLLELHD